MDNSVSAVPSYITTTLRLLGGVLGGWLLGKGYFNAQQLAEIGGGAMALATGAWGLYAAYSKNKKLNAAIAAPAGMAK